MKKFNCAVAAAALVLASGVGHAFEPKNPECIAPANPGGGWDFTCRQAGKVLYELKKTPGPVQVSNKAGGGGGVAFAEVVSKRNDDNNLIVAASTATTTRLAQGLYAGFTADQVRWVGTLGADYGVIAVAKDSPYQNLGDLMGAVPGRNEHQHHGDQNKVQNARGEGRGGEFTERVEKTRIERDP